MPLAYHTIRCPGCRAELDVTSYDSTGSRRLPAQHCDCGRRVEMEDLDDIPLPTLADLADDRTEPNID